jgi:hypothetical protein
MPEKVNELEQVWQRQADRFTELARKPAAAAPRTTTPRGGATQPR